MLISSSCRDLFFFFKFSIFSLSNLLILNNTFFPIFEFAIMKSISINAVSLLLEKFMDIK